MGKTVGFEFCAGTTEGALMTGWLVSLACANRILHPDPAWKYICNPDGENSAPSLTVHTRYGRTCSHGPEGDCDCRRKIRVQRMATCNESVVL